MIIRGAFYKAKLDGHVIDNAISVWTGIPPRNWGTGPYGHVEIWTPDEDGEFFNIRNYPPLRGDCWTSTMRGVDNGTATRPVDRVIQNWFRWDVFEIEISDEWHHQMLDWMRHEVSVNEGYSKRDLLKFIGLGCFADKKRNICSEFCHNALVTANIIPYGHFAVPSPRRLAAILKELGYEIKPLTELLLTKGVAK